MKNIVGWVKFNESMDEKEPKKCTCGEDPCECNEMDDKKTYKREGAPVDSEEEKLEEKKKNPFAKKSKEKGDKTDTKETDKGGKKKLTAAQMKLPWNKGKK